MSHVPKKGKSVVLLSTLRNSSLVGSDGKAEVNTFYNHTKGGVDILDQMCHTYSCQRSTNRWPFAFFMNLMNMCGVPAFDIYNVTHGIQQENYTFQRKKLLITFSDELVYDQIARRSTHGMNASLRSNLSEVREHLKILGSSGTSRNTENTPQKRRCHMCPPAIN